MSEPLDVDLGSARHFADRCGSAGRSAGEVAATVRGVLSAAGLSTAPAGTVRELSDELLALERFVRAVIDRALLVDRYGTAASTSQWFTVLQAGRRDAEADLWATLSDGVGASALAAGSFSLATSLARLPRHEWLSVGVLADGCRSFEAESGYRGGGAVVGPDGRAWPIVVPHFRSEGGAVFTIDADLSYGTPSAASLGGADPGWVVVGYRAGTEEFHEEPGVGLRIGVALAAATGMAVAPTVDDEALARLRFAPGTRPVILGPVETVGGSDPSALEMMQTLPSSTTRIVDGAVVPDPGHTDLINLPGNLATLLANGLQGVVTAATLGRNTQRGYEVLFEEHADGRRRARVQSFRLEARAGGPQLFATHLHVDDEGRLMETNASYRAGPSFVSPDAVIAGNGSDLREPWPVANTVIEVQAG